jgi:hypothetical protein
VKGLSPIIQKMRGQNDDLALMFKAKLFFFLHLAFFVQIIVAFGIKLQA